MFSSAFFLRSCLLLVVFGVYSELWGGGWRWPDVHIIFCIPSSGAYARPPNPATHESVTVERRSTYRGIGEREHMMTSVCSLAWCFSLDGLLSTESTSLSTAIACPPTHLSFFVLIHICRPRAQICFCTILTQIATDTRARYAPLLWFSFLLCGPRSTCSGRRFSQMTGARSYTRYSWKTACSLSLASIIRSIHSRSPGARHHQPAPSISNSFGSASQRRACARFSMTVDAPGRGDDRCCFGLIPLLCQIALMRGMRVVKGSDDGWHGSQLLFNYRKVS